MADVKLSTDELEMLRVALTPLVIKIRTGELGIVHGMERFVSTHICLKKRELELLDAAAKKLGVGDGIKRINA
jgi:hypothetical protein